MSSTISRERLDLENPAIVTDLDGTLLDFSDFSYEAAEPSLRMLRSKSIPVIFCSSKTRDEVLYWRRRLKNSDPFICENGAAVFMPRRGFRYHSSDLQDWEGYTIKVLGIERERLLAVFKSVRREMGVDMTGFSDMSIATIGELCGFASTHQAKLSAARQYTEPFVFGKHVTVTRIDDVIARFERAGLRVIIGRRFYHLAGKNDKGFAVDYLRKVYSTAFGKHLTLIGIGDSKNDIEMLKAADLSFLVMGKNRRYDQDVLRSVRPHLAGAPGPEGWRRVISLLFSDPAG